MGEGYIVRVVRLTFSNETIDEFNELYKKHEESIASQPGCINVQLVEDSSNPNIKATISKWVDEKSLKAYRESQLFGVVWPATKTLFAAKPEVWTYKAKS